MDLLAVGFAAFAHRVGLVGWSLRRGCAGDGAEPRDRRCEVAAARGRRAGAAAAERARGPTRWRAASRTSARCWTRPETPPGATPSRRWRPRRCAPARRTSSTLANERLGAVRTQTTMDVEARQAAQQQALEGMVAPVRASLEKFDEQIRAMERERGTAYGELRAAAQGGDGDAGEAARRDRQPGERAEGAGGARALGRDAAPPRRRAGRHARALRLRTSRRRSTGDDGRLRPD